MILTIAGILAILWLLGFIGNIGGGLIHILIIVALVMVIYHFIAGRRATV